VDLRHEPGRAVLGFSTGTRRGDASGCSFWDVMKFRLETPGGLM
jgi:hypothetical protein